MIPDDVNCLGFVSNYHNMILKQCYMVGTSFLKHLGWNDLGVHSRQVRCAVNYQHILELLGISLPAAFFWSTNFYQFAGRNFDQFSILAFHNSMQFCTMLLTECMCILKWILNIAIFSMEIVLLSRLLLF